MAAETVSPLLRFIRKIKETHEAVAKSDAALLQAIVCDQLWPANSGHLARVGSFANCYFTSHYVVLRQLWPKLSDTSTFGHHAKGVTVSWMLIKKWNALLCKITVCYSCDEMTWNPPGAEQRGFPLRGIMETVMSNNCVRSMRLLLLLTLLSTSSTVRGQTQKIGEPKSPAPKQAAEATSTIDLAQAKTRFAEAKQLARADNGRLWGKSVDGPMLFVDPRTRFVVGNQADAEGVLKPAAGIFLGKLPPKVPIANTACQWAGVHWSMVLWPLPEDETTRTILLMHESWHRIQTDLGLPPLDPPNAHLDTMPGRYWLQLEWRALARALTSNGTERKGAIEDALLFRQHRRGLFKGSEKEENQLELHEGLAEYTGVKLSPLTPEKKRQYVDRQIATLPTIVGSFVRSFAYLSGPAYGLLLDETLPDWRGRLKTDKDLGPLLAEAVHLKPVALPEAALKERARRYDGDKLWAQETSREEARVKRLAAYRQLLVDGPVLVLPLAKSQKSFNPSFLVPLEGHGTIYPTLTLTDRWGKLEVRKASLIATDHTKVVVAAPTKVEPTALSGDGWELRLEAGWRAVKGERAGDWKVVEEK